LNETLQQKRKPAILPIVFAFIFGVINFMRTEEKLEWMKLAKHYDTVSSFTADRRHYVSRFLLIITSLVGLSMASLCASSIASSSCRMPPYKLWIRLAISLAFFFVGVFHSKPNRDIMTPTYKKIEEEVDDGNRQYTTYFIDSKEYEKNEKMKKKEKKNDESIVSLPDDETFNDNDNDTVAMSDDETIKNKNSKIRIVYYNPKSTIKHLMIKTNETNSNNVSDDIRHFIGNYYGVDVNDLKVLVKQKKGRKKGCY